MKVIIPSTDFDIISSEIDLIIGKPKDFNPQNVDEDMDYEPEIPYKEEVKEEESAQANPEDFELSDQSDVEMKETPVKAEQKDHEELPDVTPSPMKHDMEEDDDIYTPINALSPMNSDWIIKARVSKKYQVKEWSNARGNGKLLTFELVDKYGTQIQATVFNKAVEKFDPIIEQDKVYIFCKGTVKVANQKFTAIKNDYSLTFSPYSDVTPTDDDNNISKMAFNFSTLREVQSKGEGKTLDFVGVIISAGEISSIQLKNGGTKDKRDFEVIDNSEDGGVKTIVTLWGANAKKFNFKQGSVVAFKGLRITNFKGLTLNGGDYTGVYEANELKLKESKTLSAWFKTIKDNLDSVKSLTETQEQSKKANSSNVRLISEINENVQNDLMNDPSTRYYINARVEMIKNDQKMVYMACPSCKKKMSEEDSGYTTWR